MPVVANARDELLHIVSEYFRDDGECMLIAVRLQGLGCEMNEDRCGTLISVYDLDHSGFLEMEEFVTWMMLEHVRVSKRVDHA